MSWLFLLAPVTLLRRFEMVSWYPVGDEAHDQSPLISEGYRRRGRHGRVRSPGILRRAEAQFAQGDHVLDDRCEGGRAGKIPRHEGGRV